MFDEATLAVERTYEYQTNAHGDATLTVKLDAHGESAYECPANARDEASLAAKRHMNVQLSHTAKLHSNGSSCKAVSTKLVFWRNYKKSKD